MHMVLRIVATLLLCVAIYCAICVAIYCALCVAIYPTTGATLLLGPHTASGKRPAANGLALIDLNKLCLFSWPAKPAAFRGHNLFSRTACAVLGAKCGACAGTALRNQNSESGAKGKNMGGAGKLAHTKTQAIKKRQNISTHSHKKNPR